MSQLGATRETLIASVINALREVLDSSESGSTELHIIVHEFGHTPLYAPVYVVLHELQRAGVDTTGKCWLKVTYSAAKTDDKALEALQMGGAWTRDELPCIHLGLSEVRDRSKPEVLARLVEHPFIKRLPLWGVALAGNRRIDAIKKGKTDRDRGLADFWKLFAGKLSLLQPHSGDLDACIGTAEERLVVSVYNEGSTVHRLFTGFLRDINQKGLLAPDGGRLHFVGFDDEFEPLIECRVDIAMTVQPWRALRRARDAGRELELVYTHLAKPAPVTSLYVNRDKNDFADFWPSLMEALSNLVQDAADDLYECEPAVIEYAFDCYKTFVETLQQDIAKNLEEVDDFAHAVQLLSDSRVFVHKVEGRGERFKADLERRLVQACHAYFDTKAERDPCYLLAISAAAVQELGYDWHDVGKSLESLSSASEPRLLGAVQMFKNLSRVWPVGDFKSRDSLDEIRDKWNRRTISALIPHLSKRRFKHLRFPKEEPWRLNLAQDGRRVEADARDSKQVDFSPWIHESAAAGAFRQLSSQFKNKIGNRLIPKAVHADVLILTEGNRLHGMAGLSWVWIDYDISGQEAGSRVDNFRFLRPENTLGHACLNGWWVRPDREKVVTGIFTRKGHGWLEYRDSSLWLHHPRVPDHPMLITDRMLGRQGMLFTFLVSGLTFLR